MLDHLARERRGESRSRERGIERRGAQLFEAVDQRADNLQELEEIGRRAVAGHKRSQRGVEPIHGCPQVLDRRGNVLHAPAELQHERREGRGRGEGVTKRHQGEA